MNINGYSVVDTDLISAYNIKDGGFLWAVDEIQKFELNNKEEKDTYTGKYGRAIATSKKNKSATVTFSSGCIVQGMIATQTGSGVSASATTVRYTDIITVGAGGTASTKYIAKGTSGSEIYKLYKVQNNVVVGALEQAATASAAGKFAYNNETKALTFYEGDVSEGTVLVAKYDIDVTNASTTTNSSDTFSDTIELVVDLTVEEPACHKRYYAQLKIPYCDCTGNFSILGGEQSVHNFEGDCLSSACAGASSAKYWDFVVYDMPTVA